jgi:hypothetical protein
MGENQSTLKTLPEKSNLTTMEMTGAGWHDSSEVSNAMDS